MLMPTGSSFRSSAQAGIPPPFESWRSAFVDEAVDRGFARMFVEQLMTGVQPLPRVAQLDRAQAEDPPPLGEYLLTRVTPALVSDGRALIRQHDSLLSRIERRYGVPRRFVVAIWGAETGYGRYVGDIPIFQALGTLAWEPRRASYFRRELFSALRVAQGEPVAFMQLVGSWAGAMGQPQFMPSSYLEFAVDFDRDGQRDIWQSVPDTLASIANYLDRSGWRPAEASWGREVTIPAGSNAALDTPLRTRGCPAVRSLTAPQSGRRWSRHDVFELDGSRLTNLDIEASLLTLAERHFLVQRNYEAILSYNCSHRYALSVSLLADALQ
jgi:membrane-bound lytic murein transglycosylase B